MRSFFNLRIILNCIHSFLKTFCVISIVLSLLFDFEIISKSGRSILVLSNASASCSLHIHFFEFHKLISTLLFVLCNRKLLYRVKQNSNYGTNEKALNKISPWSYKTASSSCSQLLKILPIGFFFFKYCTESGDRLLAVSNVTQTLL